MPFRGSGGVEISHLVLAAIFALGLLLRLWGIDFGLPFLSNFYIRPDETLIIVPAITFFETAGDPGFFVYPALMCTVCAILSQAGFFLAKLFHMTAAQSLMHHFAQDPSTYFLIARIVSALAGAATVFWVYGLTARLSSSKAGLLGALLLASAPLAVRDAHFGVTDSVMVFFLTGAIYFLFQYLEAPSRKERKWILISGAWIGLAVATKYSAMVIFPAALAVPLLKHRWRLPGTAIRHCLILVFLACLVFLVCNPYTIIKAKRILADLCNVFHALYKPHQGSEVWSFSAAFSRVITPLVYGPGEAPGLILAAVGIWGGGEHKNNAVKIFLLAAVLASFLLVFFMASRLAFRYVLPILPLIAVFAAKGATVLWTERNGALMRYVGIFLLLVIITPCLIRSVSIADQLTKEDTRTLAGSWIADHVPPQAPVVFLGTPECEPQIDEDKASLTRRIAYVCGLYGPRSGAVVSELYRLLLNNPSKDLRNHYTIFRNPKWETVPGETLCLVIPYYPLSMVSIKPALEREFTGKVLEEVHFDSLPADNQPLVLDQTDAFFLPMNRLNQVLRPGPGLVIRIVHRETPRP